MHQAHEVEHAVVVALHTVGDLGIPEGFDEGFFRRPGVAAKLPTAVVESMPVEWRCESGLPSSV